jgi:hypothetical protein
LRARARDRRRRRPGRARAATSARLVAQFAHQRCGAALDLAPLGVAHFAPPRLDALGHRRLREIDVNARALVARDHPAVDVRPALQPVQPRLPTRAGIEHRRLVGQREVRAEVSQLRFRPEHQILETDLPVVAQRGRRAPADLDVLSPE